MLKKLVIVYRRSGSMKVGSVQKCPDCKRQGVVNDLVTMGRKQDGLIRCPCCTSAWSVEKLGLELRKNGKGELEYWTVG